jgi:hypothetical protein
VCELISRQQHQTCADLLRMYDDRTHMVQQWPSNLQRSLLDYAVWKRCPGKVVRQLVRLSGTGTLNRLNVHGFGVLHTAVTVDHVDAVLVLLQDARVNVFLQDGRHRSPLQLAIQTDR